LLSWNAFYATDPALLRFLSSRHPAWSYTQTIAPTDVAVEATGDRTIWLQWSEVSYTADPGGYDLFSRALPAGSPVLAGRTNDKTTVRFPITGLQPSTSYELTVRTRTFPHTDNQNTVLSDLSLPVTATTGYGRCITPIIEAESLCGPTTISVTSSYNSLEWSTGEVSPAIVVDPPVDTWYWVVATGPGVCQEAATILVRSCLFADGLESGDASAWTVHLP
jgi:hypothetical protein